MNDDAAPTPAVTVCARHPRIPATFTCDKCGAGMCNMCGFGKPPGSRYCANCVAAMAPASAATSVPQPSSATTPPLIPRPMQPQPWTSMRVPPGKMCALHTTVPAADYCSNCGTFMCGVCSFDVPGMAHHHVCPTCALARGGALSSSRRTFVILGIILGVLGVFGLAALLTGALVHVTHDRALLGWLIIGMLVLAALGVAMSFSAQERNLPNTALVWTSVILNLVVLGCYLLRFGFIFLVSAGFL